MADSKSGFSVFFRTVGFAVGIAIVALCAQVALNRPQDRPKVLCLPPYKALYFFGVSLPSVVAPKEHVFIVRSSRYAADAYMRCVSTVSHFPMFEPPQQGDDK